MSDNNAINARVSTGIDLSLEDRELVACDGASGGVCESLAVVEDVRVRVSSDGRAGQDVVEGLLGCSGNLGGGESVTCPSVLDVNSGRGEVVYLPLQSEPVAPVMERLNT